jgi:hypothetical protein
VNARGVPSPQWLRVGGVRKSPIPINPALVVHGVQ